MAGAGAGTSPIVAATLLATDNDMPTAPNATTVFPLRLRLDGMAIFPPWGTKQTRALSGPLADRII
jgi:hypothetical protein